MSATLNVTLHRAFTYTGLQSPFALSGCEIIGDKDLIKSLNERFAEKNDDDTYGDSKLNFYPMGYLKVSTGTRGPGSISCYIAMSEYLPMANKTRMVVVFNYAQSPKTARSKVEGSNTPATDKTGWISVRTEAQRGRGKMYPVESPEAVAFLALQAEKDAAKEPTIDYYVHADYIPVPSWDEKTGYSRGRKHFVLMASTEGIQYLNSLTSFNRERFLFERNIRIAEELQRRENLAKSVTTEGTAGNVQLTTITPNVQIETEELNTAAYVD